MGIGLLFNKSICRKLGSMWGLIGAIFALIYPSGLDPFVFPHITQFSFFIGHLFLLWGAVYCIFINAFIRIINKLNITITTIPYTTGCKLLPIPIGDTLINP